MSFCEKCGRQISDEKFCPGCGDEIKFQHSGDTSVEIPVASIDFCDVNNKTNEKNGFNVMKLPKKILLFAGIIIVAIIVLIVLICNSGPNFKKIFKNYCEPSWAEVGSDGSYLYIDTNPDDLEDASLAYYEAYTAIEKINEELGLPDSLFEEMGQTTANDGKQSEEFRKFNVSWRYHPDKGLEVTYKKK